MMKLRHLFAALAALLFCACDSDDGGDGGGGAAGKGKGRAIKGPVADAAVEVLGVRATGALGAERGSGLTDASGAFELDVDGEPGWAAVRVTGGTFVDEDTGASETIEADAPLLGFLDVQEVPSEFAITPLTTIAVVLAQAFAHDPEATVADSVENALASVGAHFGVAGLELVLPADLTAGPVAPGPEADAAIAAAAISERAADLGVSALELTHALARDAADGVFDGLAYGAAIPVHGGALLPTAGTSDLATSVDQFLSSPRNQSGLTVADTGVDEALVAGTAELARPFLLRELANGYGLTEEPVTARLELSPAPIAPEVLIGEQSLAITHLDAESIEFEIPAGLPLGLHDLVVREGPDGPLARLREAIEVFEPADTPQIAHVSPPVGPLTGGTLLVIEGANFGPLTEVRLEGISLQRVAEDLPRTLVVATFPVGLGFPLPPVGPAEIDVINPGVPPSIATFPFEFREGDTRASSLPALDETEVFGAFRLFADPVGGVTAQVLSGRTTFDRAPSEFRLTDSLVSEAAPAITTRIRDGVLTVVPESLGHSLLLTDAVNSLEDFLRVRTNERNFVSLGETDSGIAVAFPETADARVDLVARSYWVDGIETNPGAGSVVQKTGWLELDEELRGSATLRAHGRALDGTSPSLAAETWDVEYTLEDDGSLNVLRRLEGAEDEVLTGRSSENAELVFLELDGDDGTLGFYLLTPIEFGKELGAYGGWTGGALEHRVADDGLGGDESAFESGESRQLVSGEAGERSRLVLERETRTTQSVTDATFAERVGAEALEVTPSGRVLSGDSLVGYVGASGELFLALGEFPAGAQPLPDAELALGIGASTFRDSRKSALSLRGNRVMVAAEAKLAEAGAFRPQELTTEMVNVECVPPSPFHSPPEVEGVEIQLAGLLPELEAGPAGFRKTTARDAAGTVTTTRGAPLPYNVLASYAFVDDRVEFLVSAETDPGGRFAGATFPRWIASGTHASDGQVATLRCSDEFLGDGLFFLVALGGPTPGPAPAIEATAMRLSLDLTLGSPSAVVSSRTQLQFDGSGTFAATTVARTLLETNADALTNTGGLGSHTPAGQTIRLTVPDGTTREWMTFWTPSRDAFFGFDDTLGSDRAELVLGTMPALFGGTFGDDERSLLGLELDPAASRATTRELVLVPSSFAFLSGDAFTSQRAAAHALLRARELAQASVTELGQGEARVNVGPGSALEPFLQAVFCAREDATLQSAIVEQPTRPQLFHSQQL